MASSRAHSDAASGRESLLGGGNGIYHAADNGAHSNGDLTALNGHINHAFCEIPLDHSGSTNGTLKKKMDSGGGEKICMLEIPSNNDEKKQEPIVTIIPDNTHKKFLWGEKLYLNKSEDDIYAESKMSRGCRRGALMLVVAVLVALALAIGVFSLAASDRSSDSNDVKTGGTYRKNIAVPITGDSEAKNSIEQHLETNTETGTNTIVESSTAIVDSRVPSTEEGATHLAGDPIPGLENAGDSYDAVLLSLTLPDEVFSPDLLNRSSESYQILNKTVINAVLGSLEDSNLPSVRARIISLDRGSVKAKIVLEFDEPSHDIANRVVEALKRRLQMTGSRFGEMPVVFDPLQTQETQNRCKFSNFCAWPSTCVWDYIAIKATCVCSNMSSGQKDSEKCESVARELPSGHNEVSVSPEPEPEPSLESATPEPSPEPGAPEPSSEPASPEPSSEPTAHELQPQSPTPEPTSEPDYSTVQPVGDLAGTTVDPHFFSELNEKTTLESNSEAGVETSSTDTLSSTFSNSTTEESALHANSSSAEGLLVVSEVTKHQLSSVSTEASDFLEQATQAEQIHETLYTNTDKDLVSTEATSDAAGRAVSTFYSSSSQSSFNELNTFTDDSIANLSVEVIPENKPVTVAPLSSTTGPEGRSPKHLDYDTVTMETLAPSLSNVSTIGTPEATKDYKAVGISEHIFTKSDDQRHPNETTTQPNDLDSEHVKSATFDSTDLGDGSQDISRENFTHVTEVSTESVRLEEDVFLATLKANEVRNNGNALDGTVQSNAYDGGNSSFDSTTLLYEEVTTRIEQSVESGASNFSGYSTESDLAEERKLSETMSELKPHNDTAQGDHITETDLLKELATEYPYSSRTTMPSSVEHGFVSDSNTRLYESVTSGPSSSDHAETTEQLMIYQSVAGQSLGAVEGTTLKPMNETITSYKPNSEDSSVATRNPVDEQGQEISTTSFSSVMSTESLFKDAKDTANSNTGSGPDGLSETSFNSVSTEPIIELSTTGKQVSASNDTELESTIDVLTSTDLNSSYIANHDANPKLEESNAADNESNVNSVQIRNHSESATVVATTISSDASSSIALSESVVTAVDHPVSDSSSLSRVTETASVSEISATVSSATVPNDFETTTAPQTEINSTNSVQFDLSVNHLGTAATLVDQTLDYESAYHGDISKNAIGDDEGTTTSIVTQEPVSDSSRLITLDLVSSISANASDKTEAGKSSTFEDGKMISAEELPDASISSFDLAVENSSFTEKPIALSNSQQRKGLALNDETAPTVISAPPTHEGSEMVKPLSSSTASLALAESLNKTTVQEIRSLPSPSCRDSAHKFRCGSVGGNATSDSRSGECIGALHRCDGFVDCSDGSDELGCVEIACDRNYLCANTTTCIPHSSRCDGVKDCPDADDEAESCDATIEQCEASLILCPDKSLCLKASQLCDGVFDCRDRSDESKCQERSDCEIVQQNFFCAIEAICIDGSLRCDGHRDCQDGSDEMDCTCSSPLVSSGVLSGSVSPATVEPFRCDDGFCVLKSTSARCDGVADCKDVTDEMNCLRIDSHYTVQVFDSIQNQFTLLCGDNFTSDTADAICQELGFQGVDMFDLVPLQLEGMQWAVWSKKAALKRGLFSAGIYRNVSTCSGTAVRLMCLELSCTHSDQIDFLRRRRETRDPAAEMAVSDQYKDTKVDGAESSEVHSIELRKLNETLSSSAIERPVGDNPTAAANDSDSKPSKTAEEQQEPLEVESIDLATLEMPSHDDTEESPWSYLVLVFGPKNNKACHGQVITPQHLITSALCLKGLNFKEPSQLKIFTTQRSSGANARQKFGVINVFYHPHFSQFRSKILPDYDLAVVRANAPLTVRNKKIRPVCIYEDVLAPGITCFVGSYGDGVARSHNYTTVVSKMPLLINDSVHCNHELVYEKQVSQQMICASVDLNGNTNRQPCDNDIGAPLMCLSGRAQWKLAGLLSYQRFCGRFVKQPTIFSSIHSMMPWINKVIGKLSYNVKETTVTYTVPFDVQKAVTATTARSSNSPQADATEASIETTKRQEDSGDDNTAETGGAARHDGDYEIGRQDSVQDSLNEDRTLAPSTTTEAPSTVLSIETTTETLSTEIAESPTTIESTSTLLTTTGETSATTEAATTVQMPTLAVQLYAAQTEPPRIQVIYDGDSERRVALSRFSNTGVDVQVPQSAHSNSTAAENSPVQHLQRNLTTPLALASDQPQQPTEAALSLENATSSDPPENREDLGFVEAGKTVVLVSQPPNNSTLSNLTVVEKSLSVMSESSKEKVIATIGLTENESAAHNSSQSNSSNMHMLNATASLQMHKVLNATEKLQVEHASALNNSAVNTSSELPNSSGEENGDRLQHTAINLTSSVTPEPVESVSASASVNQTTVPPS